MGLTSRLAAWVVNTSFSGIPENVIEKSKQMMLNSAAVALAVADQREVDIVSQFAQDMGGKPQCNVLVSRKMLSTEQQYAVFKKRRMNLIGALVVQGLPDINANDLDTQRI